MRKIMLLTVLVPVLLSAQQFSGHWFSVLKVQGISLRIVFHISQTAGNTYTATMDSPDQGANGIPLTSVSVQKDSITLSYDAAAMHYRGVLVTPDSISGTFKQGGASLPLGFRRKALAKTEPKRPQNPVAPFPYRSEDVSFTNPNGNFTLAGTLTMPLQGTRFPAVILITGSGRQNRDEELMGHKPFLIWADFLTRRGFAVLRFDDRGCFQSKGNFATATTVDFATDAEAALAYLKTRVEINPHKIGLMGHSEGGIIAPMVAARNKDVAFVVMLAGPGIPGSDILLQQQELIGKASGMSDKDLKDNFTINSEVFRMVHQTTNTDTLRKHITDFLDEKAKTLPAMKTETTRTQLLKILNPWMLTFLRYNPAPALEKVKCPVLAVIGSKDLQVPATTNLPAIRTALTKAGNTRFVVKELPGLNHLFQECSTGVPAEYSSIEQTVAPLALNTVSEWLIKTVK